MPVPPSTPFVLLHGAWHGRECWDKVAPLLQKKGMQTLCPNLPGRRGSPPSPFHNITLDTYVDFLAENIKERCILVGHSMGGIVVSQFAEKYPEKVEKLIYVAAFLPRSGESLFQIAQDLQPDYHALHITIDDINCQAILSPENLGNTLFNGCSKEDTRAALQHICPEPLIPMVSPVTLTPQRFGKIPKVYIQCTEDKAILPTSQRAMCESTPCKVLSLPCGHSSFLSMPHELAELFEAERKSASQ